MKKLLILALVVILVPFQLAFTSYNYSYHGQMLHSSPGYNYISHINQQTLQNNGFDVSYSDPKDIVVFDGKIYLLATTSDRNSDQLLVFDYNFDLIDVLPSFELTTSYEEKVFSKVSESFNLVEEYYNELFSNKVFYPGMTLPMADENKLIDSSTVTWESSDEKVIAVNGKTNNISEENIEVTLTLKMELWEQESIFTFNVVIGTLVEGLTASTANSITTYSLASELEITALNEAINTDFDEIAFENVIELVDANRNDEELKFTFNNYDFTYETEVLQTEEGLETKVKNIKMSKVVVEEESETNEIHSSLFQKPYTTNKASGLDVVESGIYIADTNNNRILKLTHDYKVIDAFYDIEDETFKTIAYKPLKVTVDKSERMYVVAENIFEGILELDSDGSFNRYTGVNPIKLTPFQILGRMLMSEAQKAKLQKFLPTEYTNITLNEKSFIYATARPRESSTESMIQLINPKGIDVLKRNGYHPPMGDIYYVEGKNNYVIEGPSTLMDIAIGKNGIYSVLDSKRSRIFTYDSEGNLLYVNGDSGEQSDKFNQGVSIAYLEDNLIVLDSSGTVIVYRPTDFGYNVNKAVGLHNEGEFLEAAKVWDEVLKLNTNYEVAYNGIGKYHLRQNENKEAMNNFKLGHDRYYYSKAFKNYRNEIIKDNFTLIMLGIVAIVAGVIVFKKRDKIFRKRGK